jgi:hypothetical protein
MASLEVGDQIEDCWLTTWCYLTELVNAFNEHQRTLQLQTIDPGLADLRNAMVHGVITAQDDLQIPSCIKFSRPDSGGLVHVEAKYPLTFEWIGEQTDRVYRAGLLVIERIHELR